MAWHLGSAVPELILAAPISPHCKESIQICPMFKNFM